MLLTRAPHARSAVAAQAGERQLTGHERTNGSAPLRPPLRDPCSAYLIRHLGWPRNP